MLCAAQNGSDVHVRTTNQRTALHVAADAGQDACAVLLLEAKADPLAVDSIGLSALHLAATGAYTSTADVLLSHSAATPLAQHADRFGRTPLRCALRARSAEVVSMLLCHGADAFARTAAGAGADEPENLLDFVLDAEAHTASEGAGAVIDLLLAAGWDLEASDDQLLDVLDREDITSHVCEAVQRVRDPRLVSTLQNICRRDIRRRLGVKRLAKIADFPITDYCKSLLTYHLPVTPRAGH